MKNLVLANHVTRMDNSRSALWCAVKLIHVMNRNVRCIKNGKDSGNRHKATVKQSNH
jgi:hypothetical protein